MIWSKLQIMMRESTEIRMDSLITQFWVKFVVDTRRNDLGEKKLRVIEILKKLASSRENTKISFRLRLEHRSKVDCTAADELSQ